MRAYTDILSDLEFYREAERKAATSQDYQVGQGGGQRRLQRGNFAELTAKVKELQREADAHPQNPANSRTQGRRITYLRPY